jgi:hypothetical protein
VNHAEGTPPGIPAVLAGREAYSMDRKGDVATTTEKVRVNRCASAPGAHQNGKSMVANREPTAMPTNLKAVAPPAAGPASPTSLFPPLPTNASLTERPVVTNRDFEVVSPYNCNGHGPRPYVRDRLAL